MAKLKEWILPAQIPFSDLKGSDLEECVYWLLDAMGAKDLEWRTGGTGGGAADGGRDLEARFHVPAVDGELEAQRWWIECKGRSSTVNPDEVKSAVNNALVLADLDCLVVATNAQFSNPTRDWVKAWQVSHPKPKIKLWDHSQLERFLSRHPDVVLRLFCDALSMDGRLSALESRFWNKLEFVAPKTLTDLWKARHELNFTAEAMFALIANEMANGSVVRRAWAASISPESVVEVLTAGLYNVMYLAVRSSEAGVDQQIIFRTLAYLILAAATHFPAEEVTQLILVSISRGKDKPSPSEVQEMLLHPILHQLLGELQDVCSSDCKRVLTDPSTLVESNELDNYWFRLADRDIEEPSERRILRIEKGDEPCVVGFELDREESCPLFRIDPSVKTTGELLEIIKRVSAFRMAQAADKHGSAQSGKTRKATGARQK
jgi:Restriction endonuclease